MLEHLALKDVGDSIIKRNLQLWIQYLIYTYKLGHLYIIYKLHVFI